MEGKDSYAEKGHSRQRSKGTGTNNHVNPGRKVQQGSKGPFGGRKNRLKTSTKKPQGNQSFFPEKKVGVSNKGRRQSTGLPKKECVKGGMRSGGRGGARVTSAQPFPGEGLIEGKTAE